jgi:hypothetical protein
MNRSPLFYPMNRGMDADAGGAADLQTDVMRFMAIISMCLVAIFALVQSIPPAPEPQPPERTPVAPAPAEAPPSVQETPEVITLTRPVPPPPPKKDLPVMLERPVMTTSPDPEPAIEAPAQLPFDEVDALDDVPAQNPMPTAESSDQHRSTNNKVQNGFTLRFESDDALKRLVSRSVVSLYAISPQGVQRMSVDGDALSFWNASMPQQFHEMDVATVPTEVLAAYRRSGAVDGVKWAVSLPPTMSRQLNEYLASLEGGSLVIGDDAQLSVEP